ncbi:MAG: hypothetical protein mread185_000479 [Mycoplasmataceae bacterium]|nr:MAG: hypothetical protein mread185_000479 [Mycoplasmataceae bacterium]
MKNNKIKKSNFCLLFSATFLHLFSLFCSFHRDKYRQPGCYREANYWLTFFGWWCGWASLITIVYFIYKLFRLNKTDHSYFDKVFDLIVINANIITISIFTISVILKLQPLPKNSDKMVEIFSWEVNSRKFWLFYSIIWHYLAPILTIVYFARRKISLAQTYFERRQLFFYSFLHPIIYFIYVLVRPSVPGADKFPYSEGCPRYPYFFFELITSNKSHDVIRGFTIIAIIFFWLFAFWFATLFFWWYSNHKIKIRKKI